MQIYKACHIKPVTLALIGHVTKFQTLPANGLKYVFRVHVRRMIARTRSCDDKFTLSGSLEGLACLAFRLYSRVKLREGEARQR